MTDAKNFADGPTGTDSESEVYTTMIYQNPVQAEDTATADRVSRQLPPTFLVGSSPDREGDGGMYAVL